MYHTIFIIIETCEICNMRTFPDAIYIEIGVNPDIISLVYFGRVSPYCDPALLLVLHKLVMSVRLSCQLHGERG